MIVIEAVRSRDAAELRELVERALPGMPYEAARKMVWAWWAADHPKTAKGT